MHVRTIALVCAVSALVLGSAVHVLAQVGGTVGGIAKDALGRPLPGIQLRLETTDGRVVGRTTADDQGRFTFPAVPPGTYAVVGERAGFEAATAIVTVPATGAVTADLTLASREALDVKVAAKKLEEARIGIQPRVGASTWEISSQAIEALPAAENNPLSQVLLQAPGVSQDSFNQIHVRNEHANVQYRINGVALPEGISLFGQSLSPRFANSIELITGALPAQYGLRTSGIFDIQTKNGSLDPGGYIGMYGGSFGWLQPSAEYRGSVGRLNYFVSGDYLQNDIGLSPAAPGGPIHDRTRQGHGFGYFEYILDPTSRLSAIVGTFTGSFEIPNRPGQVPAFTVTGITDFDSLALNQRQQEQNHYAVLSYLKAERDLTFQLSAFARYSRLRFFPDPLGDLMFNGIAERADRSSLASGIQAEGSYALDPSHTLRAGLIVSAERTSVQTTSRVLATQDGEPIDDNPLSIFDSTGKNAFTYSLYGQDAWRIVPSLTLNVGLRFDYYDGFVSEWQLSPRLNVVWTATPATTFHAGYARYFTPPPLANISTATLGRLVGTTAEGEVTVNSPVKSERAHYFDVGVTQQIVPGWKVGLDAYYKIAKNLLDDGQFGAPIIQTPFNYDKAYNWGVELSTSFVRGPFSAYGNLALAQQKAKNIVSAQALFAQEDLDFIQNHYIHTDHDQFLTASAGVAYRVWEKTRVSLSLLAASGLRRTVNSPNDETVPSYQQVNLGITHRFKLAALGEFEARFDVVNLLDKTYVIRDGTGVGVFSPQFGPPRGFFGGLKKLF
jgi:outer membrane receptor protein involved in Fe transport